MLVSADGVLLEVGGIDWESAHSGTAFNLSVHGIHTYFVVVGSENVLVHNVGCDEAAEQILQDIGGEIFTFSPPNGVPRLGDYGLTDESFFYHTVVVNDGRVFDQFTGVGGLPIDDWKALWTYGDTIDFGF